MVCLLDTNLLLRLSDPLSPLRPVAQQAVENLWLRGDFPALTTQNWIEFWAVATRPVEANGLGWTPSETKIGLETLAAQFHSLEDTAEIRPRLVELVSTLAVRGKKVHDARVVAAMQVHGVTHLLTFNTQDFRLFTDITVLNPHDVSESKRE